MAPVCPRTRWASRPRRSYPRSRRWVCRYITSRYRCPTPRRSQLVPWWRPTPPKDRRCRTATKDDGIYIGVATKSDGGAISIDIVGRDVDTVKSELESQGHDVTLVPRLASKKFVGKDVRFRPDARIHSSGRRCGHAVLRHRRQRRQGRLHGSRFPGDRRRQSARCLRCGRGNVVQQLR